MAPDRTALVAGLGGLTAAAASSVTRALVTDQVVGAPVRATLPTLVFAAVSMAGFLLGVLAVWSAVKAWLRDDLLSTRARWGGALGMAAMLLVVAVGPCGPQGCPG